MDIALVGRFAPGSVAAAAATAELGALAGTGYNVALRAVSDQLDDALKQAVRRTGVQVLGDVPIDARVVILRDVAATIDAGVSLAGTTSVIAVLAGERVTSRRARASIRAWSGAHVSLVRDPSHRARLPVQGTASVPLWLPVCTSLVGDDDDERCDVLPRVSVLTPRHDAAAFDWFLSRCRRAGGRWPVRRVVASSGAGALRHAGVLVALGTAATDFPQVVLEAIAQRIPVVGSEAGRELFGGVIEVAGRSNICASVDHLWCDQGARRASVTRAHREALLRFGPKAFVRRVAERAAPPLSQPAVLPSVRSTCATSSVRVLFASSNGAGVGHLTRLMAMARHASSDVEPLFFSMSQAVGIVNAMGFPCEYLASAGYTGLNAAIWNRMLQDRLRDVVTRFGIDAIVFDGTSPYAGLVSLMPEFPDVTYVWSRRAMWREGRGEAAIARSSRFDLVVEPGELAESFDRGLTVARRAEAVRVAPVLLLDEDELLPRDEARAELGLARDGAAALVQLGAGNIDDAASTTATVLRRLVREPGLQVCATAHPIAAAGTAWDDVHTVSMYPLAKYVKAFDFAVTASGYNSFHEFVTYGVPAVYVPNPGTALDDQPARARWCESVGAGMMADDPGGLLDAVDRLLDAKQRDEMRATCGAVAQPNGAAAAMSAVEKAIRAKNELLVPPSRDRRDEGVSSSIRSSAEGRAVALSSRFRAGLIARRIIPPPAEPRPAHVLSQRVVPASSYALDERDASSLPTFVICALGASASALGAVVDDVLSMSRRNTTFLPLFVVDTSDFARFRRNDLQFEYLMTREIFARAGGRHYDEYVEDRVRTIVDLYQPAAIIDAGPANDLAQLFGAVAGLVRVGQEVLR